MSGWCQRPAFERAGVLRTLAEPTLTAISGESAKFTAGGEIPTPQSEQCSVINGVLNCTISVVYKPFGVSLVFQPVVLSAGRISMRIATEVTEVNSENQLRFSTTVAPAFRVRKSDTTIELPSGASLVTAGLIQQSQKQIINGIPAMMNLPVRRPVSLARLSEVPTELLIIVTPFISKPSSASDLARPDEGYVEAKDPQTVVMGRLNKIYGVAGAPNDGSRYRGHVGFISDCPPTTTLRQDILMQSHQISSFASHFASSACIIAAACAKTEPAVVASIPNEYRDRHPIVVAPAEQGIDIFVRGPASLTSARRWSSEPRPTTTNSMARAG